MAYVYTEKEFTEIKLMYANGQDLETIQGLFPDKSVASIRMKLVKAGLYVAKSKPTAGGPTSGSPGADKVTTQEESLSDLMKTKAGIKLANKRALDAVGLAPW
jgi:hypothetical protein